MITTHEADEAGRIACRPSFTAAGRPDLALKPGASTCGHQACRKIRMRIRLSWPSTLGGDEDEKGELEERTPGPAAPLRVDKPAFFRK
jgi:hypothetical protein